jgi:hypothetical protein
MGKGDGLAVGIDAGEEDIDGEDADMRRIESSSTSYRLQLEGGSGTPGTAERPGARLAPAD